MASLAKGIALKIGGVGTTVRVEAATSKPETFHTVCCDGHDPTRINAVTTCPVCGPIADKTTLKKGKLVGDQYVIVEQAEIAELKKQHVDAYKKVIDLKPHPLADVMDATVQGESMYRLIPDGDAGAAGYALIAAMVEQHPDLAFVGVWAARTRTKVYVIRAKDGVITMEERVRPVNVKPAPEFDKVELGDAQKQATAMPWHDITTGMALFGLPDTTPFNPDEYTDDYLDAVSELLSNREGTDAGTPVVIKSTPANDMMAALAAMVATNP